MVHHVRRLHSACVRCRGLHYQHLTHCCCSMPDHNRERPGSLCQQGGMEATSHDQTEFSLSAFCCCHLLELMGHRSSVSGRCVQVTGITLSKEQLGEAKLRV